MLSQMAGVGYLHPYGIRIVSRRSIPPGEAWPTSEKCDEYAVSRQTFRKLQRDVRYAGLLKAKKWKPADPAKGATP